jgi:hypothetical protein
MKTRPFSSTKLSRVRVKFRGASHGFSTTYCVDCGTEFTYGNRCVRCAWAERSNK